MNLDNFRKSTTYQNDFEWVTNPHPFTGWEQSRIEKPEKESATPVFRDHETFAAWRDNVKVPFDLLWRPKPILQTNPHQSSINEVINFKSSDDENEFKHILKTRPRIYMTPAVSLDDVPDPEMRALLCKRMYTTEWRNAEVEAAAGFRKKQPAAAISHELLPDSVKFQREPQSYVPQKFRLKAKEWDDAQTRLMVDPTQDFWLRTSDRPHVKSVEESIQEVDDLLAEDTKASIAKLIATNQLRLAHDKPCPTYAGYQPRLSKGVPLSKVALPVVHPFLSTSQATTARYADHTVFTRERLQE